MQIFNAIAAVGLILLVSADLPRKKSTDGHYMTRDGRHIGHDCNPCKEEPEPGYVPPVLPDKERRTMAGACSPNGADGKGKPGPECSAVKKPAVRKKAKNAARPKT